MAGRPTDYRQEYCQLAIDLMSEGASITEVAAKCGVDRKTLYNWMDANPEFLHTIKKGMELCEAWWEEQGRSNLKTKEFQAALWYMNMKNRFKWADKQQIEHSGNQENPVIFKLDERFRTKGN
ncbi:MAG TPA: phBC6A51 family helix-turn-helix protein [Chitinophagaceae bacterium]|nr:phBC6A51 family helix-turn-helix protein [Chitinophagaceae bacterium]